MLLLLSLYRPLVLLFCFVRAAAHALAHQSAQVHAETSDYSKNLQHECEGATAELGAAAALPSNPQVVVQAGIRNRSLGRCSEGFLVLHAAELKHSLSLGHLCGRVVAID